MAELTLKQVSKTYANGVCALKPTDLQIQDGEFVVLVGPSGCGKSTLLRMIAGLESCTSGDLLLDNRSLVGTPPKNRDVAMVFQSYALYPHMTVRENLEFGLRMRKIAPHTRKREVEQVAEMLELTSLLDRRPAQISGGQQQRVALGRAIVRRPKLFLFDEPLSNLDAKLRTSTRAELIKLQRQLGITSIYVTHDQLEAMSMADKLVVMKDGRVQQEGKPLDIYRDPANQFVASFLGAPPMNVIPALLRSNRQLEISGQVLTAPSEMERSGTILLGLRPEDLRVSSTAAAKLNALSGQVSLAEPLGSETLLTVAVGPHDLVARIGSETQFRVGNQVALQIDWQRVLAFEQSSGNSLGPLLKPGSRDSLYDVALES
jgi:multiple sugar transport system ATP-binding protein